jgi:hypothetical protein
VGASQLGLGLAPSASFVRQAHPFARLRTAPDGGDRCADRIKLAHAHLRMGYGLGRRTPPSRDRSRSCSRDQGQGPPGPVAPSPRASSARGTRLARCGSRLDPTYAGVTSPRAHGSTFRGSVSRRLEHRGDPFSPRPHAGSRRPPRGPRTRDPRSRTR